jgi:CubicO group peptidase (beta-lactamase class C family)
MKARLASLLIVCVVGMLVWFAPARAETGQPPAITATLGDPQELETFIDGEMARQMEELNMAGAVVVIVQGDRVLLSKGYGYADVEKGIPVDAEHTLFRPGSVTKLFTWTAVMQLVEQGKLDLQADVNTYLTDFQIPATYPQPVTMLDLMAHTPGFEDTSAGMVTYKPEELTSLGVYLARYMPEMVFPPGQMPSYSNYGATLAGHIVEQVSGEPYDQYVEEHILKPLGMDHSSIRQSLPAQIAAELSKSYEFNGEFQEYPIMWLQVSPAGALSASGADMGKFMLAHLNDGDYNGARILQPETARRMHTQSYTFDPALTGSAYGFMESTINGRRLIGHEGDLDGFHTDLKLIPEEQVGFYVCYNTHIFEMADRAALLKAFMDHYFPPAPATQVAVDPAGGNDASHLARYTGFYINSRNNFSSPDKWFALVNMMMVRSGPGNTLLVGMLLQQLSPYEMDSWVEVQPRVFQNTRNGDLMAFKEDEQGQVRYLALSNDFGRILIKQPWHGRQDIHLGILVFSLLTFVLTAIAALLGWVISLSMKSTFKRGARGRSSWQSRLARGAALALCLAFLAFVVIFILNMEEPGHPLIRILAWVVAALAAGVTPLAVIAWQKGWWNRAGRLHYTVIVLAGLGLTWFLAYWNLLVL